MDKLILHLRSAKLRIRKTGKDSGFTLVELLVVIAITSILTGLLMAPLINGFTITRRTQAMVRAQDAARNIIELVTREVQSAIYVYDNSGQSLTIPLANLQTGDVVAFNVAYAKLDLVPPKMLMHCNSPDHPAGEARDYSRGDLAWPQCPFATQENQHDVEARPTTPIEADSNIVRYFVGLKDPTQKYDSPEVAASITDNTFVLYRAEFNPYDENLIDNSGGANGLQRPDFFYNMNQAPNGRTFAQNWMSVAKLIGPHQRIDLVQVKYDSNEAPTSVMTTVKFVPNVVTNDVLTPTDVGRAAEGEPDASPTTYRASSGQWGPRFTVRLLRDNLNQLFYTGFNNGDLVIFNGGGDVAFNITAWKTSRTVVPPNPEMMFDVDPNRGEITFAFQMPPEVFPLGSPSEPQSIIGMNELMRAGMAQDGAGLRMITLDPPVTLTPNSDARIVPGSERVFGPNWTHGPNYGASVQYNRVAFLTDDPGPNEYRINYRTGEIIFYSLATPLMPEVKADGSDADDIEVHYSVQNNRGFNTASGDLLSADYVTKNLLAAQIGFRTYDDRGKPMLVALNNNIFVRNFHR